MKACSQKSTSRVLVCLVKQGSIMSIKIRVFATLALSGTLLSTQALAADMEVLPAGDWTGFHVGIGGGYGGVNHRLALDAAGFGDLVSFSGVGGEGGLFTVEGGYDYQIDSNFVLGIQGDYTFSGIGTDLNINVPGFNGGYSLDAKNNFTVAGRAGWLPSPDTLLYGLVGWTWTEFNGEFTGDAAGGIPNYNFNVDGLTVGAGIETRFTPNITGKLEYRYTDYGNHSIISGNVGQAFLDFYDDVSVQSIRAVVSYQFGNPGGYVSPTADLPPVAEVADWSGFRIGGGGGYGLVNHTLSVDVTGFGEVASLSGITGEGGLFTAEVGYDHQFSEDWVAGIQFDYTGSSIATELDLDIPFFGGIQAGYKLEASDSYTVAGRLGYLVTPDTLAYGLVGYTWSDFEGRFSGDAIGVLPNYSFDVEGLTVGAGVETNLFAGLTGKLEYRYTMYDSLELFAFNLNDITQIAANDDISVQSVRAVISYKLPLFR